MSATRTAGGREPSPPEARTSRSSRARGSRAVPRNGRRRSRRTTGTTSWKPRSTKGASVPGSPSSAPRLLRRLRRPSAPGQRAPRHRILLACTAALALGLVAVLLLNTVISQRAFRQHELEIELILLSEHEEALARAVQLAESPVEVERAARKLGMVPAASPVFLRLADGAIMGEPVPAPSPTGRVSFAGAPGVLPTPSPTPSASTSATPDGESPAAPASPAAPTATSSAGVAGQSGTPSRSAGGVVPDQAAPAGSTPAAASPREVAP